MHRLTFKHILMSMTLLLVSSWLVACQQPVQDEVKDQVVSSQPSASQLASAVQVADEGKSLTDIANQPRQLPSSAKEASPVHVLSVQAKPFVGRYKTVMLCSDNPNLCDEGSVEYILSLLEDGSVHRTIVKVGAVQFNKKMLKAALYRKDTWELSEDQQYIVIHLSEGADFYYQVLGPDQLMMDLTKAAQENSKEKLQRMTSQRPYPKKPYLLIRQQENIK